MSSRQCARFRRGPREQVSVRGMIISGRRDLPLLMCHPERPRAWGPAHSFIVSGVSGPRDPQLSFHAQLAEPPSVSSSRVAPVLRTTAVAASNNERVFRSRH